MSKYITKTCVKCNQPFQTQSWWHNICLDCCIVKPITKHSEPTIIHNDPDKRDRLLREDIQALRKFAQFVKPVAETPPAITSDPPKFKKANGSPPSEQPAEEIVLPKYERPIRKRDVAASEVVAAGYVYIVKALAKNGGYKIGRTANPKERIRTFDVVLPFDIEVEHIIPCDRERDLERLLHQKYKHCRIQGEWFDLTPEDIAWIKSIECYQDHQIIHKI